MTVQPANTGAPASGGQDCACTGATCDPWCRCVDCADRTVEVLRIPMGTSFGYMLCEIVETLVAHKCGDHVLTGAHHDADGAIMLVFDTQADTNTDTDPTRSRPRATMDPPGVHPRPGERVGHLKSV